MSSNTPFHLLIHHLPDGVVLLDQSGWIQYMNPSAEKLTGATLNSSRGRHWRDVFTIRIEDPVKGQTGSLMEILQERPVLVTKTGRTIPIELQISNLSDEQGRTAGSMLVLHDVTSMDMEKEGLKESRAKYKRLVNTIEGIVWEGDGPDLRIRFISDFAEKLLGYSPKRWTRDAEFWKKIIHPEDRASVLDIIKQSIQQRENYQIEYRIAAADGKILLVRDTVTITEEDGQIRLSGVITDITEAKQARDLLIKSEERFAAAFYANPVPLLLTAISGRIVDLNESFERATGFFREQLLDRTITETGLCPIDQFETIAQALMERTNVRDFPFKLRTRNGIEQVLTASFERMTLSGEPCLLGIFR